MEHISSGLVEHSNFGDKRLSKRFGTIVTQLGSHIGQSIPTSSVNTHQTKAVYRFMDNEQVTPREMQSAEHSRIYHEGCAVEKLQLETPQRLLNAITIYSIIAAQITQITQLRYFALCDPTARMTVSGCTTSHYNLLVRYLNINHRFKLPIEQPEKIPTIKDFLQLVAFLGGGKKQNEWGIRALWKGWNKAD